MLPRFIVCGLEHTGTTLISDLFRQLPGVDAGFECGVLLRDNPAEFRSLEPFYGNMRRGWGVSASDLQYCTEAASFEEFYRRLMEASSALTAGTTIIFDKTPRYLSELSSVLARCDCPVVITYKDPRAIVCSDYKRAKTADFDTWYESYRVAKLRYVRECYQEFIANRGRSRVTTVRLEDLAMDSRATMERMFAHVGAHFELKYAVLDRLRYVNTRGRTVSAEIVFDYMNTLHVTAQERILSDFNEFEEWIYE